MSWIKSALSKAAEAGGKNIGPNLSKTVKTYAGSVYLQAGQAVAGGAKIVQDRLSGRNLNNFKHAVRRLDEVALNARGEERKQALARWLGALKDIDKELNHPLRRSESDEAPSPRGSEEELATSPRGASMVLFFDAETGGEPVNFRDVFLRSHAVENIVTSVILETPSEEELPMLLEIFGLCLTGGQELHHAIVSSIQDLAKVASTYEDEVLTKREELLEMARGAVSGLKLNPEVERLDADIAVLQQQISEKEVMLDLKDEALKADPHSGNPESSTTTDIIELQVRLRQCLQRKSFAIYTGDTPEERTLKVQKLKELSSVLTSSSEDYQAQLTENQKQKQEAMNFRVTKAQEVTEVEKVVAGEVRELDKRRQDLEEELKEVKAALAAATARHIHTQEEKEQFDEASSNMVAHLSLKEEGLSRNISARTTEESIVRTWVNFLEDTWVLQSSSLEQAVKDTTTTWEKSKQHFFQIAAINLVCRQEEAKLLLKKLKFCAEELESLRQKRASLTEPGAEGVIPDVIRSLGKTQSNYLETEAQLEKMFKGIAQLQEETQAYQSTGDEKATEEERKVMDSFEALATLKKEMDAQQRPEIEVEKAEKVEKKAIQQGRAIFEKARSQVIETGEKIRAVTSKHDSSKDLNADTGGPKDERGSAHSSPQGSPQISPPTTKLSGELPRSEDPADVKNAQSVAQGEPEGWELDEVKKEVGIEDQET